MSKLELAEGAGNVVRDAVKGLAEGTGPVADAAQAAERLLEAAGGTSKRATLSLSGRSLEAARTRIEEGPRLAKRGGTNSVGDAPEAVTTDTAQGGITKDGRIVSWKAPEDTVSPFTGQPVKVTEGMGLQPLKIDGADSVAAKAARPAPRELTAEERLPTSRFEEPREQKTAQTLKDGTIVTKYGTEIPFEFKGARGNVTSSGEYIETVAQHEQGPMKGWVTLHNPDGISKIGYGPENGANYLGQTSPTLDLKFQPQGFQRQFPHLAETGVPAFVRGDTTFLRAEINNAAAKEKPTMVFVDPKGDLAGAQWAQARVMQDGPFAGLKGTEINIRDGEMKLIDRSEHVGTEPKTYIYRPDKLGMENIQTWSEMPKDAADPKKAIALEGRDDTVVVPQLLHPRKLMNIVDA